MKIHRTIPPAAALIGWKDLWHGAVGFFSGDAVLKNREQELRKYFDIRHVFLVSSGKAALYLILKSLRVLYPQRDEVIVPAYTCFSVPSAIVRAGLKVIPCDIDPYTFDFNHERLRDALSDRILAVISGHLFGIPSHMDAINKLCRPRGIVVIEDAAQAMGGYYQGMKLGTIGDVGFFSLGRGKNLTCGSGGIIITNTDIIAAAIKKEYSAIEAPGIFEDMTDFLRLIFMRLFIHPSLYWFPCGIPFLRLGETIFYKDFPVKTLSRMKAGLLRNWGKKLEESNNTRRANAQYFRKTLNMESLLPDQPPPFFLRLPLLVKSKALRDSLFLKAKDLGISLMYPTTVNEIEEIKDKMGNGSFPIAKMVCDRLLNLPTHQLLSQKDRDSICGILKECTETH